MTNKKESPEAAAPRQKHTPTVSDNKARLSSNYLDAGTERLLNGVLAVNQDRKKRVSAMMWTIAHEIARLFKPHHAVMEGSYGKLTDKTINIAVSFRAGEYLASDGLVYPHRFRVIIENEDSAPGDTCEACGAEILLHRQPDDKKFQYACTECGRKPMTVDPDLLAHDPEVTP